MEGIKESLVAAGEALQSMVEEVERFEKEMEEKPDEPENLQPSTMLALLKDGRTEAMEFARPYLIKFLEGFVEQTATWVIKDNEVICGNCGEINVDGSVPEYCSCGCHMINTEITKELIIFRQVKTAALCKLCAFGDGCCHSGEHCLNCTQNCRCCDEAKEFLCRCDEVNWGEHCPYFEKKKECKCQ